MSEPVRISHWLPFWRSADIAGMKFSSRGMCFGGSH